MPSDAVMTRPFSVSLLLLAILSSSSSSEEKGEERRGRGGGVVFSSSDGGGGAVALARTSNASSLSKFLTEPQLGTSWYDPDGPTPTFVRGQTNGTVTESLLGDDALLDCRVTSLERDLVSWLFVREERRPAGAPKRRHGGGRGVGAKRQQQQHSPPPVVLTVGFKPHSAENRFILDFKPPNNYRLRIRNVQWRDEGRYICQLSVHPPSLLWQRVRVVRPLVHVLDGDGQPVSSLHYDEGSTIQMICRVRRAPLYHTSVRWQVSKFADGGGGDKGDDDNATAEAATSSAEMVKVVHVLNQDVVRGGVKVDTGREDNAVNFGNIISKLSLARAVPSDTGNYSCHLMSRPDGTAFDGGAPPSDLRGLSDTISVHVLQGENTEAIYSRSAPATKRMPASLATISTWLLLLTRER